MASSPENAIDSAADRLVIAFKAGQLLNQLDWHLTHYALTGQIKHRKEWERILAELAEKAVELAPDINASRSFRQTIEKRRNVWRAWFDSVEFGEDYERVRGLLQDQQRSTLVDLDSDEHPFRNIIDGIIRAHGSIWYQFKVELECFPEFVWSAVLLGETVDRGLRPHNSNTALTEPENSSGREGGFEKITLQIGWAASVKRLWKEVGLSTTLPEFFDVGGTGTGGRLEDHCIKSLEQLTVTLKVGDKSQFDVRLEVDVHRCVVTLDGLHQKVKPDEAAFLDALIKAKGQWRSGPFLRETIVELASVRIDRLVDRLIPALKELVEAQSGKGYRIDPERLQVSRQVD